jgi:hypothetical protein
MTVFFPSEDILQIQVDALQVIRKGLKFDY